MFCCAVVICVRFWWCYSSVSWYAARDVRWNGSFTDARDASPPLSHACTRSSPFIATVPLATYENSRLPSECQRATFPMWKSVSNTERKKNCAENKLLDIDGQSLFQRLYPAYVQFSSYNFLLISKILIWHPIHCWHIRCEWTLL